MSCLLNNNQVNFFQESTRAPSPPRLPRGHPAGSQGGGGWEGGCSLGLESGERFIWDWICICEQIGNK